MRTERMLSASFALLLCLLTALLWPLDRAAAAGADRDVSRVLSLEDCIRLAESSPPVIWSQRAQHIEAEARVEQARALPNPSFSYVAQDLGLQSTSGPLLLHQVMVGFAPLAALLRIQESRAACAGRAQALAAAREDLRLLRTAVGQTFYDLRLRRKLHQAEQDSARLADQTVSDVLIRKRNGEASGLDVVRAQAEALDAHRTAVRSEHQLVLAELAFSILLGATSPQRIQLVNEGPDISTDADITAALPAPLAAELTQVPAHNPQARIAALIRFAQRHRPALQRIAAEQLQATEQRRLSTLQALPLADVQLAAGIRSSGLGIGGVVALSGSLPLFDWNLAARHRAEAQGLRAQAQKLEADMQIALEIESLMTEYSQARAQRTQQALPLYQLRSSALAMVRRLFSEGSAPLSDVVQASRDLFAAQRGLAQIERDELVARWRLVVATGAW